MFLIRDGGASAANVAEVRRRFYLPAGGLQAIAFAVRRQKRDLVTSWKDHLADKARQVRETRALGHGVAV